MKIPTEQECFELLKQEKVPHNIVEHSIVVTKAAIALANKLIEKGESINLDLLKAGGLLHDIDKIKTLQNHNHGHEGYDFLMKKKYVEVAQITKTHLLDSITSDKPPKTWEEKLIFYADKRVNHSTIVSLKERFDYFRKQYGKSSQGLISRITSFEQPTDKLEKEIFNRIGRKPEELAKIVEEKVQ